MNWRRIRKWSLIAGVIGLVVVSAAAWNVGGALVASAHRAVGPPPTDFAAKTIEIPSKSGATLAAWHLPLPDSHATVIFLHAIRGDRRSMLSRARLFRDRGYSTLLVDLQAHGESRGEQITVGYLERHDVLAAVNYIRTESPHHQIAIIGRSLGGAATLLAKPNVDALVLESVYPTVSEAVHNRIAMRLGPLHHVVAPMLLVQLKPRLGCSYSQLRPIDQINKVHCPVLIASGESDQHTTLEETRRIYNAASKPKKLVIFDGAAHVDLLAYDSQKYESEVMGFIDEVLAEAFLRDVPNN